MATPSSQNIVIVGGHGKVALRLTQLLISANHSVVSVIRDQAHSPEILKLGAQPTIISLEEAPVHEFAKLFTGIDVIYFTAGAGGKGGEERTKKVDYEGAVKVFDAIEAVEGTKPRLILVSCIDVRDPAKIPAHYDTADIAVSVHMRRVISVYMDWKYEADKVLVKRTGFKWFILRPGGLLDIPGTGKADIGRTHLVRQISRDDVAEGLFRLLEYPEASGLALDMVGGDVPISQGLASAINKRETDFLG